MYLPLLPSAQKMQHPPAPPTPARLPILHSTGVPLAEQSRGSEMNASAPAPITKHVEWLPIACEGIVVYIRHLATPPRSHLLPIL